MKIPQTLYECLSKKQELRGSVDQTLARFEPWIKENKTVFFPEYTDHGPEHVERVMQGAEALIRDEAWDHITAEDAGVLVLSILLHDCAMHLSRDGFLCLLDKNRWNPKAEEHFIHEMGVLDWPARWDAFQREAKRFDQKKLKDVLDDDQKSVAGLLPLPENQSDWSERHCKLIGEFIRRHHAILAHEIALAGIPGPGDQRITFAAMEGWMRDVAGYIARSHNEDLRKASDLDRMPRGSRGDYRGVHVPFLMAVLRVADYLEIDASRARAALLQVRQLRSPFSRHEWKKHEAVKYIREDASDREALFVDAEPKDVKTYLGLKDLLYGPWGIQKELDVSWSVLGEVYGRDDKLRALGLCIRRVRSTLDKIQEDFDKKKIGYVPVHAKFRVSGGEMLKLLVGPLYGDEPGCGVRELMQNAVDCYPQTNQKKLAHPPDQGLEFLYALARDCLGWCSYARGIAGSSAWTLCS